MADMIDPWSSEQYADYARLRDQFGIEPFDPEGLPEPQKLFRRGVIFGHRGFGHIEAAIKDGRPFTILTGLMPSGRMHIGNKMVMDQVMYYQSLGASVLIAVADLESYGARHVPMDVARKRAVDEYVLNYIAMGLKLERCHVYFQSKRAAVKDLSILLSSKVTLSNMRAIYGFDDSTNLSHFWAPMVQMGDILHPMLDQYEGLAPVLVPVGVDQDPHMRLTRDIAFAHRLYNVTRTRDGRVGVFVKVDDGVADLLDAAEKALGKELGFLDFEKIPDYKALYVKAAREEDLTAMDHVLVQVERKDFGGRHSFYPPASSYHRFMTGLDGGKMSSSREESAIFLTDSPEEAGKKIGSCKTGGGVTVEEHRKNGGRPEECVVCELFTYHLVDDDSQLEDIISGCRAGKRLCGECKTLARELMGEMLSDLAEKRREAEKRVGEYLRED